MLPTLKMLVYQSVNFYFNFFLMLSMLSVWECDRYEDRFFREELRGVLSLFT